MIFSNIVQKRYETSKINPIFSVEKTS